MSKPSNIELDAIAEHLFLFRPESETRLPPVMHDAATESRFGAIVADPLFVDLGLAIVAHPPAGSSSAPAAPAPQAFLWNEDDNWDIGSAGKLSLPLAALVLRRDVQHLLGAGLVTSTTSGEQLDSLFRYVWTRHPSPAIAALTSGGHWPTPSMVLDWTGTEVTIKGHVPRADVDWGELLARAGDKHISFGNLARTTFHECLLLAIGRSDNAAARVCQGALGVGFADAVIEKLGLFEWASPWWPQGAGTGMRVAGLYGSKSMPKLPKQVAAPKRGTDPLRQRLSDRSPKAWSRRYPQETVRRNGSIDGHAFDGHHERPVSRCRRELGLPGLSRGEIRVLAARRDSADRCRGRSTWTRGRS